MPVAWNQLRVCVHCRWRVMPSLSFCLWPPHTQFRVAGVGIFRLSGTPRKWSRARNRHHLERPNIVLFRVPTLLHLHTQARVLKNNPRALGPNVSPQFVFSGVLEFRAFRFVKQSLYLLLYRWHVSYCFCFVCLVVFVLLCARVSDFLV